jgi:hypothetical protein
MSRAFANQNNKLSSGELTKREAFRNKYMMQKDKSGILYYYSQNDNKPINYSDYNYIISQAEINCISCNIINNEIIRNTTGEIYIGNYMTLSGESDISGISQCNINNGNLNFFIKSNNYTLKSISVNTINK